MTTVADIEEEVFKVLRTLTPRGTIIKGHQRLIADLKLLSDDATTMIIDLERKYHIRLPQAEWDPF
jgi:acyl carrier protein